MLTANVEIGKQLAVDINEHHQPPPLSQPGQQLETRLEE